MLKWLSSCRRNKVWKCQNSTVSPSVVVRIMQKLICKLRYHHFVSSAWAFSGIHPNITKSAVSTDNYLCDKSENRAQCQTLLHRYYAHRAGHGGQREDAIFCSPVVDVPDETGLLWAGASGQCRPPNCGQQVAPGETAPSCFPQLPCLVASRLDRQQAQSVPGSAIENLRCLLSVKTDTYYLDDTKVIQSETKRGRGKCQSCTVTVGVWWEAKRFYETCLWVIRTFGVNHNFTGCRVSFLIRHYECWPSDDNVLVCGVFCTPSLAHLPFTDQSVVTGRLWNDYMAPM